MQISGGWGGRGSYKQIAQRYKQGQRLIFNRNGFKVDADQSQIAMQIAKSYANEFDWKIADWSWSWQRLCLNAN